MTLPQFTNLYFLKSLFALILTVSLVACGELGDPTTNLGDPATNYDTLSVNILGLKWTAPSAREDGSPLSPSEIAGFNIYYGTEAGDYQDQIIIDDPSAENAQVEELPPGTYYLVVTAVDTDGRESLYSPEIVINL